MNKYFLNNVLAGVVLKDAFSSDITDSYCVDMKNNETDNNLYTDLNVCCNEKERKTGVYTDKRRKNITESKSKMNNDRNKNEIKEQEFIHTKTFKLDSPMPHKTDVKKLMEQMSVIAGNQNYTEDNLSEYLDICARHERLTQYIKSNTYR